MPGTKPYGIIIAHGIRGNKEAMLPDAVMCHEAGYHVLTIDLRGHGLSEGDLISYGYYEALDVQAGLDYLLDQPDLEKVGLIGHSLGGAAVVRATAIDERIKAVVVENSFSSLPHAINDSFSSFTGLPAWPFAPLVVKAAEKELGLTADQVNSTHDLATMKPRPVLIIHGEGDDLLPVSHAYKMYEAASEPKELWIIKELGHEYPIKYGAEYHHRVLQFFERAFKL